MKYAESTALALDTQFSSKISEQLTWDYAHYQTYPLAKNKVMVRLENLFDKFELDGVVESSRDFGEHKNILEGKTKYVDLN